MHSIHTCAWHSSLGRQDGWELCSGPVHPPLGRWDLIPLLCQVTHPSADLGWGFREGVCFPGVCLMLNPKEMAPPEPSGSLATRPAWAPEPCPLSVAGPGFWLPGGYHFPKGSPTLSLFAVIVSPAAGELLTHSWAGKGVSVNQFETRRAAFPQPWREGSVQDWVACSFPEEPSPPRVEAWPTLPWTAILLTPNAWPQPYLGSIYKCRFRVPAPR